MECFEILGIEPTHDTKQIRISYSNLLSKYSPETDPEGFQKLRHAYEDAIKYSKDNAEKEAAPLSPVDKFMQDFKGIYKCYEKRLSKKCWTELLDRDICCNIDTSKEISKRILTFLMDDYNLPHEVWCLFDSYFSWSTKKDKLNHDFPTNFVDFIIYRIQKKNSFRYEAFTDCKEGRQDEFIDAYNKGTSALDNFDIYTLKTSIDTAREICPMHPDILVLYGRYLIALGRTNEAETLFKDILETHNDDLNAYFYLGDIYLKQCKMNDAYENYKKALEVKPDSIGTLYNLGKCSICLEKYDDTIEYLERFNKLSDYDSEVKNILTSAYNFSVDSTRKKLEQNPEDTALKFKLAKTLFRIDKTQESYELLNELKQECDFTQEMYMLLCQELVVLKNNELSYSIACEGVDKFRDDFDLNFYKASSLDDLQRYEEAIVQYDKAIAINEKSATAYNNKSYVLSKLKRYNEALDCANKSITLDTVMPYSYKNKAEALLNLELYQECLDACEKSLNLYQYMVETYIVKMKALTKVRLYDEALTTYKKATDLNLKDSRLYLEKAHVLEIKQDYDNSMDFCDLSIEADDKNGDAYYYKGLCYYNKKLYDNAIECFDKAIKYNCESVSIAYYYKAQCLIRNSKKEEALSLLDTAISLGFDGLDNYYNLKGSIFLKDSKYEEALCEYKKAIDYDSTFSGYYYSAGDALNEMNKFSEAAEYIKKSVELDPTDANSYVSLSYSLYKIERYEECIENCNKAIEINPKYATAYQNKGWALYNLKRYKEAEDNCAAALKINGNNEDILNLKLSLLRQKGLNEEALMVTDRILEINPKNQKVLKIQNEILAKYKKKKGLFGSLFG